MRNTGIRKLQYLLCALLVFALTGCGASNLANLAGNSNAPGSIAGKLAFAPSKAAAKAAVASVPAEVTGIQVTVTGTGTNGVAIPVVRGTIDASTNQGSIGGIYPGKVTMTVKAMNGAVVAYEGFAIGVVVNGGQTTTLADPIIMTKPSEKAQDAGCIQCHETTIDTNGQNLIADFKQSGHYTNSGWTGNAKYGITGTGCAGCHGPSHNDPDPSTSGRCYECHGAVLVPSHKGNADLIVQNNCITCHQPHNIMAFEKGKCIACHAMPQNATAEGDFVNDNNGVRAITTEFSKWSHHVTGVTLNDAHCTACHLEGTVVNGEVLVDTSVHMSNNKTHLRNADTDADLQWDPAAPSFSTLDNFCLSCHDGNGATSPISAKIQAFINANGLTAPGKTASATNPFGDTISNGYDKMQRPAVVDAAGQFNTGNNSHHAVIGKKYSGRSRVSKGGTIADATFTANSSAAMPGVRSTLYDAGRFNGTYVTLADAAGEAGARNGGLTVGDDSTLHCADCHTVGQYRAADVGVKPYNKAVIGAHGANNEYLLRNNAGTDARHVGAVPTVFTQDGTKPYLVCFNCHVGTIYGGQAGSGHAGEHDATNDCNGPYNTFGNYTASGTARLIGRTSTGALVSNGAGYGFSNIFGIQCANCHNSGVNNGYGGIHGSKVQTYTDGMGNTSKHFRFMPGLANAMFVPGTKGGFTGGTQATYNNYSGNRNGTGTGKTVGQTFNLQPVRNTPYVTAGYTGKAPSYTYTTGGISNDLNWEQTKQQSVAGMTDPTAGSMGCYTLNPVGSLALNLTSGSTPVVSTPVAGMPAVTSTAGYPANDIRLLATDNIKAVDGSTEYGNWGSCNDHKNPQGKGTGPTRGYGYGVDQNFVRPVTY